MCRNRPDFGVIAVLSVVRMRNWFGQHYEFNFRDGFTWLDLNISPRSIIESDPQTTLKSRVGVRVNWQEPNGEQPAFGKYSCQNVLRKIDTLLDDADDIAIRLEQVRPSHANNNSLVLRC